jgi:outer membrane biosynthesis protein TonB
VAEVEIDVDRSGNIKNPVFTKTTGNKVWDDSVRQAVNLTKSVNHAPPTNFPSHVTVKFDVQEAEPVL